MRTIESASATKKKAKSLGRSHLSNRKWLVESGFLLTSRGLRNLSLSSPTRSHSLSVKTVAVNRRCSKQSPDSAGSRGQSLHTRSHGESFLALLKSRLTSGLFLLDEPESALSPKRQLELMAMMVDRIKKGKSQFIIATHSPILMTYPGATVVSFDLPSLESVDYRQSDHFLLTKGILDHPQQYWKHLWKE